MDLYQLLEKNIIRWIGLVERFYYRPERSVRDLARDLHADRNTVLADVTALANLLSRYVAARERGHGTVTMAFKPTASLLSLEQSVYRQSNVLSLACAYLVGGVDMAQFARERGLSISSAYAINKKVQHLFGSSGASVVRGRLEGNELDRRLLAILIWSTTGYRSRTMRLREKAMRASIEALCGKLGQELADLDHSFIRTALGIALDRQSSPLPPWFVEALRDIPLVHDVASALSLAGLALPVQEQRFLALTVACVISKNPTGPYRGALRRWVERDPSFGALRDAMLLEYGSSICDDDLFAGALQRLYLYTRFGVANTALMQRRDMPEAFRPLAERNAEIVSAWAEGNRIEMYHPSWPMAVLFTLQILPLARGVYTPQPFVCAVVTMSELNQLTFSHALERAFPSLAHVVPRARHTVRDAGRAIEDYRGAHADVARATAFILVDLEYPTAHAADDTQLPVVATSLSEACSALPLAVRDLLPRRPALDVKR